MTFREQSKADRIRELEVLIAELYALREQKTGTLPDTGKAGK